MRLEESVRSPWCRMNLRLGLVRILVQVVDAVGVEQRGAALDAVDFVALAQQEFGEVGAVLAGDAGDEGFFGHVSGLTTIT